MYAGKHSTNWTMSSVLLYLKLCFWWMVWFCDIYTKALSVFFKEYPTGLALNYSRHGGKIFLATTYNHITTLTEIIIKTIRETEFCLQSYFLEKFSLITSGNWWSCQQNYFSTYTTECAQHTRQSEHPWAGNMNSHAITNAQWLLQKKKKKTKGQHKNLNAKSICLNFSCSMKPSPSALSLLVFPVL